MIQDVGALLKLAKSQRLLLMAGRWSSYCHDHLPIVEPNPLGYSVARRYERVEPIMEPPPAPHPQLPPGPEAG